MKRGKGRREGGGREEEERMKRRDIILLCTCFHTHLIHKMTLVLLTLKE